MHFKFFTEVFFDVPLVFFTTASMGGKICTSQTRSSYSTQWSHSQLLPEKKKTMLYGNAIIIIFGTNNIHELTDIQQMNTF